MTAHGGSKRGSMTALPAPHPVAEVLPSAPAGTATVDLSSTSNNFADGSAGSDITLVATDVPRTADARIGELERQLQWSRDDIARLQTLLSNLERDGNQNVPPQTALTRRQEATQQQVTDLQQALETAYRSYATQQSTINDLSRRIAEMDATLAREREEETQALDGLIHQMEQLLQFQAEQTLRERLSQGGGDAS